METHGAVSFGGFGMTLCEMGDEHRKKKNGGRGDANLSIACPSCIDTPLQIVQEILLLTYGDSRLVRGANSHLLLMTNTDTESSGVRDRECNIERNELTT